MGFAERDVHIKLVAAGSGLYKRYDVPVNEAMTIVLIGRDGGEKYRSNTLTTPLHFFTLIDGMPMRRAEMRNKKNDQR